MPPVTVRQPVELGARACLAHQGVEPAHGPADVVAVHAREHLTQPVGQRAERVRLLVRHPGCAAAVPPECLRGGPAELRTRRCAEGGAAILTRGQVVPPAGLRRRQDPAGDCRKSFDQSRSLFLGSVTDEHHVSVTEPGGPSQGLCGCWCWPGRSTGSAPSRCRSCRSSSFTSFGASVLERGLPAGRLRCRHDPVAAGRRVARGPVGDPRRDRDRPAGHGRGSARPGVGAVRGVRGCGGGRARAGVRDLRAGQPGSGRGRHGRRAASGRLRAAGRRDVRRRHGRRPARSAPGRGRAALALRRRCRDLHRPARRSWAAG